MAPGLLACNGGCDSGRDSDVMVNSGKPGKTSLSFDIEHRHENRGVPFKGLGTVAMRSGTAISTPITQF